VVVVVVVVVVCMIHSWGTVSNSFGIELFCRYAMVNAVSEQCY
jgi:hypothetical protein